MSLAQQYVAIALIGLWALWLLARRFGWLPSRGSAQAKKGACGGGACPACSAPGTAFDADEMAEQLRQG